MNNEKGAILINVIVKLCVVVIKHYSAGNGYKDGKEGPRPRGNDSPHQGSYKDDEQDGVNNVSHVHLSLVILINGSSSPGHSTEK